MQVTYSRRFLLRSVTDIPIPPLNADNRINSLVSVAHQGYYELTPFLPLGAAGVL